VIKIFIAGILFSNLSFAYSLHTILVELDLEKADVIVKENRVEIGESSESTMFDIILNKPTTFRGNSLGKGSHLVFDSRDGLLELMGRDSTFTFDGVQCLGNVEFRRDKFCGCSLAKPFRVSKSVSVPKGAKVQFSEGKIRMFRMPRVDPRERKRESASGPVIVGGVTIAPGDTYSIENGKVVRMENPPESFCF